MRKRDFVRVDSMAVIRAFARVRFPPSLDSNHSSRPGLRAKRNGSLTAVTLRFLKSTAANPTTILGIQGSTMKRTILTMTFVAAMIAGSATASAWDNDSHYKDIDELKQLHAAFHAAVSHAGIDAPTKAQHLSDILAVFTDDAMLVVKGVTYSGKGTPGTASCAPGSLTLCDLYSNIAGAFVLGHNWVSLTPIFTEAITVLDDHNADIYFQCIYFDLNNNDALVSNATIGVPGMPDTGRARKVHGHWLLSYAEVTSVAPPTLDVN